MSQPPNYKAELVGAFGHPIAENPTVVMQEAGFQALHLNWRYLTIEVYPQDLAAAFVGLRAMNFRGINLTIPHKVEVLKYLDEVAPDAALIGAVNTVRRVGDKLIGENTDGKGFLRALQDIPIDPRGKKVILLGAGGAARAIGVELALAGAEHITIVNRSVGRGQELVDTLNTKTNTPAQLVKWTSAYAIPSDANIVVNATSIGLFPDVDAKPDLAYDTIKANMIVCDVIPNPPHTRFLQETKARGATALNGLGMLVYQGAIAFKMWTGQDAPTEEMYQALQAVFG
jgi:shikimate dehydrogenase